MCYILGLLEHSPSFPGDRSLFHKGIRLKYNKIYHVAFVVYYSALAIYDWIRLEERVGYR